MKPQRGSLSTLSIPAPPFHPGRMTVAGRRLVHSDCTLAREGREDSATGAQGADAGPAVVRC